MWLFDAGKGSKLACKEDFSTTNGFSGPRPGALHQWPLLRQQQVILCFIHQISEMVETRLQYITRSP